MKFRVSSALRVPDKGLWCNIPVLTAWFITLFKWLMIFLVVSRLPLAASGLRALIASGANLLSSGLWPNLGNTWFSSLRHKLLAVTSAIVFNVWVEVSSSSWCWSSLYSLGSMSLVSSSLAAVRFFSPALMILQDKLLSLIKCAFYLLALCNLVTIV